MELTHCILGCKIVAKSGVIAGYINKPQFVAAHAQCVVAYLSRTQCARPVKVDGRSILARVVCDIFF